MPKEVLLSVQPYWVFLIIAKAMGWNIDKEKTVEVRKNYPKADDWDKTVKIYCSKDKKSFARIPKEYQPLMQPLLGKIVGEFVCDRIIIAKCGSYCDIPLNEAQLDALGLMDYAEGKTVYGWHISDLVIYDKPKSLRKFKKCNYPYDCCACGYWDSTYLTCHREIRPPQSWCYVEV